MNKKWIIYGVTGLAGIGIVAGGATAAAASMDLRTTDGTTVSGGALTDRGAAVNGKSVIDGERVQLSQTNSSVTVVSAPSASTVASTPSSPSAGSVASAASAPDPQAPVQMSTPSAPSAPSPATSASPVSAPTAASVASAPSS